jgi:uncharacterized protein YdhG (YjbR/CyaY superfamily)
VADRQERDRVASPRFGTVEEYLGSLPATQAATLRGVIDLVLGAFPDLEAKTAWNVPQIHRGGEYVFGVSALKDHLALAPWSAEVIDDFRARLEGDGYVVKKNLFQVPDDWEIDERLVGDLVRARLAELDDGAPN